MAMFSAAKLVNPLHQYLLKPTTPNLWVPPYEAYEGKFVPEIPDIHLAQNGNMIDVTLDFPNMDVDHERASSSMRARDIRMDTRSVDRFTHDLVFGCFKMSERVMDEIDAVNDAYSAKIPDYIDLRESTAVVFEYTTVSADYGSIISVVEKADKKLEKYVPGLRVRSKRRKIAYIVFAVSEACVCTNYPGFEPVQIDNLIYGMRIAKAIKSEIIKGGFEVEVDTKEKVLYQQFNRMTTNWNFRPLSRRVMNHDFFTTTNTFFDTDGIPDPLMRNKCLQWVRTKTYFDLPSIEIMKSPDNFRAEMAKNKLRSQIREFKKEEFNTSQFRNYKKSLCLFPFVQVTPLQPGNAEVGILSHGLSDYMPEIGPKNNSAPFAVVDLVIQCIRNGQVLRMHGDEKTEREFLNMEKSVPELLKLEEEIKSYRSSYHRVKVKLTDAQWEELAIHGYGGKRHANHQSVIEHKIESKKLFHHSTPTDDIDYFIKHAGTYLTEQCPDGHNHGYQDYRIDNLLQRAISLHKQIGGTIDGFAEHMQNSYEKYYTTRAAKYTRWLNDIAYEITLSRRSHTKPDQLAVKRLRHYKTWINLFCLGSTKPTSFQIFMYNKDIDDVMENHEWRHSVFRSFKTNGIISWSPFYTITDPKLVNPCRIEALSMIYYFTFAQRAASKDPIYRESLKGAQASGFATCMIIALHNKQQAADAAIISRYIMLNGFVSWPMWPNPGALLGKLEPNNRSRLAIFFNNKLIESCQRLVRTRFIQSEQDDTIWFNLFHWVDGQPLKSILDLVNSFYYCYAIGKCKTVETNYLGKLVEAVACWEDNLPADDVGLGLGDKTPENIGPHQFSLALVQDCIRVQTNFFIKKYGSEYKRIFTMSMIKFLLKEPVEPMATLKATSEFGESWLMVPIQGSYKRSKVAAAMLHTARQVQSQVYLDLLQHSLDCMHLEGCLYMCLFPKDQVAGIREIYVLKITGRIVQAAVERAGLILCSKLDSEIISHPENKYTRLHNHMEGMSHKGDHVTFGSSCDMTKWNHTNYISKFYYVLAAHFEPEMRPLFFEIMSFWENKKIMVPQRLTEALMKHDTLETRSKTIKQYHAAIKHNVKSQCFNPGEAAVNTAHGFCQGIYQLTSSYFHATFMHYYKLLIHKEFRSFKEVKLLPRACKLYITDLISSDDSSILISLTYTNESQLPSLEYFAAYAAKFRTHLAKLFGMIDSTKSVIHTKNFVEFNSKYTAGRFTYEPLVRQIHALANVTEAEGLMARQEESYGIMEGLHEYGASIYTCSMYQMAQGMNQYRLLGSSVSPIFDEYYNLIKKIPDPSLGFFLMDDPRATGLTGLRYNIWVCSYNQSIESKLSSLLRYSQAGKVKPRISAGLSKHGFILGASMICLTDFQKAKAAFEKIGLPENWRECYNVKPFSLYRDCNSIEELELAIAKKLNSPGAINSFSGGSTPPLIAVKSSVFVLHRLAMRIVKVDAQTAETECKYFRSSIMRELSEFDLDDNLLYWKSPLNEHLLTETDRGILFPSHRSYCRVRSILNMFNDPNLICRNFGKDYKKRVKVAVYDDMSETYGNLANLAGIVWKMKNASDQKLKYSKELFKSFQAKFSWLKMTHKETLDGPFEDAVDLHNFLVGYKNDRRHVRLMTKPIKTYSGLAPLKNIIESHYYDYYSLTSFEPYEVDHIIPIDFHSYFDEEEEGEVRPSGLTSREIIAKDPVLKRYLTQVVQKTHYPPSSQFVLAPSTVAEDSVESAVVPSSGVHISLLMHEIHATLTLPLSSKAKGGLIKMAIIKHPRINVIPECSRARENMLIVLQAYWNNDKDRFIRAVQLMRREFLGVWHQSWNRATNTGYHNWDGAIRKIPVRISVIERDNRRILQDITIAAETDIPEVLSGLASWMTKNKVEEPMVVLSKPTRHEVRSTRFARHKDGPIKWTINPYHQESAYCRPMGLWECQSGFRVTTTENKISLVINNSTLFTFYSSTVDYMPEEHSCDFFYKVLNDDNSDSSISNLIRHWVNNYAISLSELASMIHHNRWKNIANTNILIFSENLDNWCRDILDKSLDQSGVRHISGHAHDLMNAAVRPPNSPDIRDESLEDIDFIDVQAEAFMECGLLDALGNIENEDYEINEDIDHDLILGLAADVMHRKPDSLSIITSHPMIGSLLQEYTEVKGQWDDIITNRVWCSSKQIEKTMVSHICKLLGIRSIHNYGTCIQSRTSSKDLRIRRRQMPEGIEDMPVVNINFEEFD